MILIRQPHFFYKKMKNKIKAKLTRFSQMIYLTSVFYIQNNLDSCASACTFGFIFSFIPIIMMILTIFIGILRASPEIVEAISHEINNLTNVFDVNKFVENIYEGISFSWVNILLAIFIIWMARKLFITIIKGLYSIFNTEVPPRPFINQLLTIASEICIVIISSVVFFAAFTTRQLFSLPLFEKISFLSPVLFSSLSNVITNITLYFVLFIFSVFAYKIGTGSKPPLRICFLCSALCIGIFYICIIVISFFINKANYNTIYGVLSNLIILLFEVYIFFSLFMYFAQLIYTFQYFDSLLLAELYLIPQHESTNLIDSIKKLLFIKPAALMTEEIINISKGQNIYNKDNKADGIFYVVEGTVEEITDTDNEPKTYKKGSFFGDVDFLLNIDRSNCIIAKEDCKLIHFSNEAFSKLIEKNPQVAAKAIKKLSQHSDKIYEKKSF